jgi:hypothetical protein
MIDPRLLARMALLARRRPPLRILLLVLAVILGALALWGIEQRWGWPEALTPEGHRRIAPGF